MSKIGLFFGPEKGSVHRVAKKIEQKLGADMVDLHLIETASVEKIEAYDKIIFGISTVGKETWSSEHSNTDWAQFFPNISKINFENKSIALFGLGDHITYPNHFVDAMGKLYQEIKSNNKNANIVAPVDTADYEFSESEAVVDNQFVGLPIDEDFEPEQTEQRLDAWLKKVCAEFAI